MTLARAATLHPKPFPMGPPPPLPDDLEPAREQLLSRTGKSIRRAFSTRRSSPQASVRRKRAVSARVDMISSPVLHHDDEGRTLKSLAKMGVILGNEIGPGAGNEEVTPLQISRSVSKIQRKPVPRPFTAVEEPVIEEPVVEEPVVEEAKSVTTTTKRDKRRGFVFDGLDADSSLEIPHPVSKVMDWRLHNVPEEQENEDEDEDMDGLESPVSSSCAHEADPVDSMRWSFLAPSGINKQDSLCVKIREEEDEGEEGEEETEDLKEMQRELESVETLLGVLTTSFAPGAVSNYGTSTPFGGSYEDLKMNETPSKNIHRIQVTNSRPDFAEESPTLGHCPTLHIIKRIEVARSNIGTTIKSTETTAKSTKSTKSTRSSIEEARSSIDTARSSIETTRSSIESTRSSTEETTDKPEVEASIRKRTEVNNPEFLKKPELKRRPPYVGIQPPEESLRAVLSSPTSRKSFSEFLDSTGSDNNNSNKRDSNILRLWLAARAHSAALQYAAQLAEEIKSTCSQEFPDILEPAQNTETVEVSKIEDKAFNEMLRNDFPEFRRQSQVIPKEIQDSLDKLVAPKLAAELVEETEDSQKKERHHYPISIIDNAIAEQNSELALKKEAMLDSLIKPVPFIEPAPVMKVSSGHQRKIQLSASKHRSFHAVQSFRIDEAQTPTTDQIPEIPKIPIAYRNSAPSSVNMPVLKPVTVERPVEASAPVDATVVVKANPIPHTIVNVSSITPKLLNAERVKEKNSLADVIKSEIMSKVTEPQPVVEKSDLAAMGIVKRNRALIERMAALEGARV